MQKAGNLCWKYAIQEAKKGVLDAMEETGIPRFGQGDRVQVRGLGWVKEAVVQAEPILSRGAKREPIYMYIVNIEGFISCIKEEDIERG